MSEKTSLNITATTPNGTVSRTAISDINPAASDADLLAMAQIINGMTTNSLKSTSLVTSREVENITYTTPILEIEETQHMQKTGDFEITFFASSSVGNAKTTFHLVLDSEVYECFAELNEYTLVTSGSATRKSGLGGFGIKELNTGSQYISIELSGVGATTDNTFFYLIFPAGQYTKNSKTYYYDEIKIKFLYTGNII